MTALAAALLAALCLFAADADAGIVEQYEAASDSWRAVQSASRAGQPADACAIARRYDEMMAEIDAALVKGQLLLVRPNLRYLDLDEEERRDLRAFYARLDSAHGEAAHRCGR